MGTDPFDNLIDLPLDGDGDARRHADDHAAEDSSVAPRPPGSRPPEAPPEPQRSPPGPPPPRRRRGGFWWPALLLLIAIAGALGWYFYSLQRTPAVMRGEPWLVDFGEVAVGTRGEAVEFTLRNDDGRAFTVSDLESDSPAAVIDRDECRGRRLEPKESCVVALRLRPTEAGPASGRLTVSATAANSPLEVPWVGTGTAPRAAVEPAALAFGETVVGQTGAPRALTVRNAGVGPLAVREVVLEGTAAGEFQRGDDGCRGVVLPAGASCRLEVAFAPRLAGPLEASLRVLSDSAEAVSLVWLSGTGVVGARLRFAVDALDFGIHTIGAPAGRRELKVVHEAGSVGAPAVSIAAVELAAGDSPFEILEDRCAGRQLASGAHCAITVAFAPTAPGAVETPLRLRLNEPGEGPWIPLRGAAAPAVLQRQPEGAIDFGEQAVGGGPYESSLIALTNRGEGALPLGPIRLAGDDRAAFALVDDGCGGRVLAPGERCGIRVRFQPAAEGVAVARLEQGIAPAAGSAGTVRAGIAGLDLSIPLRGVGASAALGVDPARLDLGSVRVGEAVSQRLRLSNPGRAPLALESPSINGEGFSVDSSPCPARLEAGASCHWEVRFTGRRAGVASGRLEIASNAGSRQVALAAGVTVPTAPQIAVQPSRLDFGGQPVGERGEILDVVIDNPGTGRLVLESLRLEGAEAGDFRLVPGSCEGAPFLAPGGDCTVGVRFLPTAPGERNARLRIPHNAGAALTVGLSGEGI